MTKNPSLEKRSLRSRWSLARKLAWMTCWAGLVVTSQAQTNFAIVKSFGFPALSTGSSPESEMILGGDQELYGVTLEGGSNTVGVIFKVGTDGSDYQVLHEFQGGTNDGAYPAAELLQGSDGALYGTTEGGGTNNAGVIFTISADGSGYRLLHSFSEDDGVSPEGGLLEGREDGLLYGTTTEGGKTNYYGGTVFKVEMDGSAFHVLYNFGIASGAGPMSGLVEGTDGYLYGTTITEGGYYGNGSIFKLARNGSFFRNMYSFLGNYGDGGWAQGRLVQGSDGYLYGTCKDGGNPSMGIYSYLGNGTVYSIDTNGNGYQILYSFPTSASLGATPLAGLQFGADGYLYGVTVGGGSGNDGVVFKMPISGNTITVIHNFDGSDGISPEGALTLDGSVFYGTTHGGGANGFGTAFQVSDDGNTFGILHDFSSLAGGDGTDPAGPVSIFDGVVYGTTLDGAASGYGAAFALNLNGSGYEFLASFTNNTSSQGALLKAADGFLYGTTQEGGSNNNNYGVVYKISAEGGPYMLLHSFTNGPGDGAAPLAGLIQGADGALYGTTSEGGTEYGGTVFKINPVGGAYSVLYSFGGSSDGDSPHGSLVQDSFGVLYGTTEYGGTNGYGTVFSLATNSAGAEQVIHSFAGATNDGSDPQAGLCLGQDGRLYGTASDGGSNYDGIVFALSTNGESYAVLHSFAGSFDGSSPQAQPVQNSAGFLYGTCSEEGSNDDGTVFKLNTNGGAFAVLHQFTAQDYRYPVGGVALAPDGSIWGAASDGGSMNNGAIYELFSPPELISAPGLGPTGFTLNFSGGAPNQMYQILVSTDLMHWMVVGTQSTDGSGSFQYTDTSAGQHTLQFYKISGP